MLKSALILRHLPFEGLSSFGSVLEEGGYRLIHIEAGIDPLPDPLDAGLVLVLGGPTGAIDGEADRCITVERDWLAPRPAARRPTLRIRLGAQLMAAALGARVLQMLRKEILFGPVTLSAVGFQGPQSNLADTRSLHWHSEDFDIPDGADNPATTKACATRTFAVESNVLRLQFHPEAGERSNFERWTIGHKVELAQAGIDPDGLRHDEGTHGASPRCAGQSVLHAGLRDLPA